MRGNGPTHEGIDVLKLLISEHGMRVILVTNAAHLLQGRDEALDRRIVPVRLLGAGNAELVDEILPARAATTRRDRGITITQPAQTAAVGYSNLHGASAQPDAAIALVSRATARAVRRGRDRVDEDEIAELAVEQMGTINTDLAQCEAQIGEQIVGHGATVHRVLERLLASQRRRLSVRSTEASGRVLGPPAEVLAGPSGNGKSSLVRAIHRLRCGPDSGDHYVLKGADFGRPENLNRELGPPPAFVGFGMQGGLIRALKRNPRLTIEFSEPELGCQEFCERVIMPVLDGTLDGNEGDSIPTRGTAVFITTNCGSGERAPIGFCVQASREDDGRPPPNVRDAVARALPTPVWSRLGGRALWMGPLAEAEHCEVLRRWLVTLADREGVAIAADDACLKQLVASAEGLDSLGVRALRAAFDDRIADPIERRLVERNSTTLAIRICRGRGEDFEIGLVDEDEEDPHA
jgi:ATP-dependent Clp protease ATP-binding subunit ClpA